MSLVCGWATRPLVPYKGNYTKNFVGETCRRADFREMCCEDERWMKVAQGHILGINGVQLSCSIVRVVVIQIIFTKVVI